MLTGNVVFYSDQMIHADSNSPMQTRNADGLGVSIPSLLKKNSSFSSLFANP